MAAAALAALAAEAALRWRRQATQPARRHLPRHRGDLTFWARQLAAMARGAGSGRPLGAAGLLAAGVGLLGMRDRDRSMRGCGRWAVQRGWGEEGAAVCCEQSRCSRVLSGAALSEARFRIHSAELGASAKPRWALSPLQSPPTPPDPHSHLDAWARPDKASLLFEGLWRPAARLPSPSARRAPNPQGPWARPAGAGGAPLRHYGLPRA